MPNYSMFCPKPMLLAGLLASSMMLCSAQNATTPPASKAAPKKAVASPSAKTPSTKAAPAPLALTTQKDKTSYAIGVDLGNKLKSQSIDVDTAILMRGMKDAVAGSKPLMTDEDMRTTLGALSAQIRQKQTAMVKELTDKNKSEGETFLAENKSKEGVVTLPSGLQYKILKAGDGPKPAATDSVVCNYKGTLINGKEFDSSYKRGQPATFPVSGVIKGWTEALQLMPVGSKWQLFVPPDLAYGERGAGADIQPDSTLLFEVELMSIQDKSTPDKSTQDKSTPEKK
ncbi:MAG TPA: FKBP-type peptidyl-prolyl cis-trans isomerase [Terriglobales bacterium]|nr:FKBP-type peptidyl-prolyl cis-trans isomerase [Terriglobales bacterium]